jgi:plasmid stability protein
MLICDLPAGGHCKKESADPGYWGMADRERGPRRSAIIDSSEVGVAQLVVRKLDPEVVRELRKRAARSGRSMEAEHREILRAALRPGRGAESLKGLLLLMPDAGEDSDFARTRGKPRRVRL